ncbi:hypothetical protein [Rhodoferax antarcticus]|uniref:hypothetical protein n=1 Tax=Rhodoferax antarcticus TaxID=81479 RepID=UPI0011151BF5|nr:hypothetical protein [Rhodoferax antarcticus]
MAAIPKSALNSLLVAPLKLFLRLVLNSTIPFAPTTAATKMKASMGVVVCTLLVLSLHWAVLGAITSWGRSPKRQIAGPQSTLKVSWIQPNPYSMKPGNTGSLDPGLTGAAEKDLPLGAQTKAPNATSNSESLVSQADLSSSDSNPGWSPLLYRSSHEVDTRTVPAVDWVIHPDSAPKNTLATVVVTVWVSAMGVVDHFQIEDQQPAGDWTSATMSSLQTTIMEPATLGGEPVASTMTIEIFIDNHGDAPRTN